MSVLDLMQPHRLRLERRLGRLLSAGNSPAPKLREAMHYSVLNGGKRLRPMLAWAAAEALGAEAEAADIPAYSLELIHSYSLIHDDLPAMDDDRLRRGKPTCHIQFDEATAILAGDALQTLAFSLLADSSDLAIGDKARLRMVSELSQASGVSGMVAGQSLDIETAGQAANAETLEQRHLLKTGALIRASVVLGGLCSLSASSEQLETLAKFGECIGLAFQIRDDILDVISDTDTLGKEQGRDIFLGKPTFVSVLGMHEAESRCHALIGEARELSSSLGTASHSLMELAEFVIARDR